MRLDGRNGRNGVRQYLGKLVKVFRVEETDARPYHLAPGLDTNQPHYLGEIVVSGRLVIAFDRRAIAPVLALLKFSVFSPAP